MVTPLKALKSVEVAYEQGASEFGTNLSGSATFTEIPTFEATFNPDIENLTPTIHQQSVFGVEKDVMGRDRGATSFKMLAQGSINALDSSTTPSSHNLANILHTIFGGKYGAAGSTATAVASGSITCQSGQASRFRAGGMCYWYPSGSTDRLVSRTIARVNSNDLEFKIPVKAEDQPVSGSTIYNTISIFLTQAPTGSCQFRVKEANTTNTWYVAGCQANNVTIEGGLGQLVQFAFEFQGAKHYKGENSSLSRVIYGNTVTTPPVLMDSQMLVVTASRADLGGGTYDTTYSPIAGEKTKVNTISMSPNLAWQGEEVVHGVNNLLGWVRDMTNPTAVSTILQDDGDYSYVNARDNRTEMIVEGHYGSSPGTVVGMSMGRVQAVQVSLGEVNGISAQEVTMKALENDAIPASATGEQLDLARSPMVFHLG